MAKVDTTKIEGYDSMTAEQKLAALEAYDIPEPDYSGYVKKDIYDKTASDLADWKKRHNALLSDEEKKKQAADEELSALRKQVEEMQREKLITGNKAQLLALGYDETLAAETAKAMAEGDNDKVFANQKKFLDSHDKAYKAQLMSEGSKPPAGSTGSQNVDYAKLIEDAKARGDFAAEAYYTRVSQQENKT